MMEIVLPLIDYVASLMEDESRHKSLAYHAYLNGHLCTDMQKGHCTFIFTRIHETMEKFKAK